MRAPLIFVGHGSPMNAIGDNKFRKEWTRIGKYLGKPKAIVAISAHWDKYDTSVRVDNSNPQVFDMYGFPSELYEVEYEPKSDIEIAKKVKELLNASIDNTWGIDHGIWSVLSNMYPECDIPVIMVSINEDLSNEEQYEIGKKLKSLREDNIMILASGNIIHNLRLVDWDMSNGYKWADEFDKEIKELIENKECEKIVNYEDIPNYELAIPTKDHFIPLLNILGAIDKDDKLKIFNEDRELGAISMTSYIFEDK